MKGKGWPKLALPFRASVVTTLNLHGTALQAAPGGPIVLAIDLARVRKEFDNRYPLDGGGNRQKQLSKRRQDFRRARLAAQSVELIEVRKIDGTFMVWLAHPEDEGVQPPKVPSGRGDRDSSVTT
jgi:hypothetical protein